MPKPAAFDPRMRSPFWVELRDDAHDVFVLSLWFVAGVATDADAAPTTFTLREASPRGRTMVLHVSRGTLRFAVFEAVTVRFSSRLVASFRQWEARGAEADALVHQRVAGNDDAVVVLDSADV